MSGRAARARPERARPRDSAAPREVLDALRDLPAAVAPLIKRADATKAELRRVDRLLALLVQYAAHGSVDHDARVGVVLGDEQARLALLQVVGVVVRWRLSAKPARGDAAGGRGTGGNGFASSSGGGSGGSGGGGGGASGAGASSGGGSASTSHSQPDVPSTARSANAAERWSIMTGTMAFITCLAEGDRPPVPLAVAFYLQLLRMQTLQACARQLAGAAPARTPAEYLQDGLQRVLCCLLFLDAFGQNEHAAELAFALRDSALLEHAFRLLLRALAGDPPPAHQQDVVVAVFVAACTTCSKLSKMRVRLGDERASPAAAAMDEVCSGTCLRHAVFVQLVATLCAADGGLAYGLPQELLRAVPILVQDPDGDNASLRSTSGRHRLSVLPFNALFAALAASRASAYLTPRASLLLLHRVARLALTSAEAWTPAGVEPLTAARRSGAPQPLQLVLGPNDAELIAYLAIRLVPPFLQRCEGRKWLLAAVSECWQLVDKVSRLALALSDSATAYILGKYLGLWICGPAPSRMMLAAMDGGALLCVERWLRRAGDAPAGHEAAIARGMLERRGAHVILAMLLYGEPSGAASLAATVAKLLRRTTAGANTDLSPALAAVVAAACGALDGAVIVPVGDFAAAVPQVMSYAAWHWLPQLSRIARGRVQAALCGGSDAGADMPTVALDELSCVLRWLPLLAWRCAAEAEASGAGGSGSSAASKTASPATDAGGWHALLVDEVCAVQLLGDALQLMHAAAEASDGLLQEEVRLLAASCCAVAAACPREVCAAAAAGAAGDARWRPEALLRALLPVLRATGRHTLADRTEALAAQMEAWAAGGAEMAPGAGAAPAADAMAATEACVGEVSEAATEVGRLLVPPAEARSLLRTCSNPACTRLAGDSEAGQRLQACGGCGACMYDCRECQVAHWRTGHKEACARLHGA